MVISKEIAEEIDKMDGLGVPYRKIALEVGLNREKVRRYLKGEVNINDTENNGFDTNNDLYDNKAYLNEQLQTFKDQLQQEFIGVKANILDYIREELPLSKTELLEIKKENKSIKGKIEFLKKVLKEFNAEIYKKVCNNVFNKDKKEVLK